MVEIIKARQHGALDDGREHRDDQRRQDQRRPEAEAGVEQDQIGGEGAEHVLGAMGEVDHPQQSENDRKPETQEGVERAVDEADQELAEQCREGNAEDHGHLALYPHHFMQPVHF